MNKLSVLITILFLSFGFTIPTNNTNLVEGTIEVIVNNIRSAEGQVIVSLYTPDDDFPNGPSQSFFVEKSDILNGTLSHTFTVSANAQYAVVLLDDENRNNDMDYNFLGLPKEGYGFSNDAKPRGLSSPRFEDASFEVGENGKSVEITMKYML